MQTIARTFHSRLISSCARMAHKDTLTPDFLFRKAEQTRRVLAHPRAPTVIPVNPVNPITTAPVSHGCLAGHRPVAQSYVPTPIYYQYPSNPSNPSGPSITLVQSIANLELRVARLENIERIGPDGRKLFP